MPRPRPTFDELYQKYKREGTPRWFYLVYFAVILTAVILIYVKMPSCWRPGGSCSSSGCSDQPRPAEPEQPRVIRVF